MLPGYLPNHPVRFAGTEGLAFRAKDLIHLQSYGPAPAVPARDLQVGNITVWNFGVPNEVTKIEEASAHFLNVTLAYDQGGPKQSVRRMKKDRLVALSPSREHRARNPQIATLALPPESSPCRA